MSTENFLQRLKETPNDIEFSETMSVIENAYEFTPSNFTNGQLHNMAGQNSGSCKLLAFAQLHQLNETETLHCFGSYYRNDVLQKPDANDHQNIRNFMQFGWAGVKFERPPLQKK